MGQRNKVGALQTRQMRQNPSNKRIFLVLIAIFLPIFGALGLSVFIPGLREYTEKSMRQIFNLQHFELLNSLAVSLFSVIFAVLGYVIAKRRSRRPIEWAVICLFTNLWGFIVLLMLPPKGRVKGSERER
jgi:uncharacterized BrkB/YihY/UPF0761 family membrane protein